MAVALYAARLDIAFQPGVPAFSDLGNHLVVLQEWKRASLSRGHLLDWSHTWFSGYPVLYFYFPLPALLVVLVSLFVSLDIAIKLVAVSAPALLVPAAYSLLRGSGFGRGAASAAACGTLLPLLLTAHRINGGNILSSVMGEYSFALGLVFAVLYLGEVARALRGTVRPGLLALTLALTALSHLIPAAIAATVSIAALFSSQARRAVLWSWLLAFGVSAFWALPFLARCRFMGTVEWPHATRAGAILPLQLVVLLPWLAGGLFVLRANLARTALLFILSAAALAAYLVPQPLFAQARALPFWYVAFCLLIAGAGALQVPQAIRTGRIAALAFWAAGFGVLGGVIVVELLEVHEQSEVILAAPWSDRPAYDSLGAALERLPPGLTHSEHVGAPGALLGDGMALAHLAGTAGVRTTVGLLRESALTGPAYMWLLDYTRWESAGAAEMQELRGTLRQPSVEPLQLLGVRYFVSFSERAGRWAETANPPLERVASAPKWTIWEVPGPGLVEVLRPSDVRLEKRPFRTATREWLRNAGHIQGWPTYLGNDTAASGLVAASHPAISDVALGYRALSFRTNAIGAPHLLRVAYFPNWRAVGASGPYLVAPGFMLVIPRRPLVSLRFQPSFVERAGALLSGISMIAVLALGLRRRVQRFSRSAQTSRSEPSSNG